MDTITEENPLTTADRLDIAKKAGSDHKEFLNWLRKHKEDKFDTDDLHNPIAAYLSERAGMSLQVSGVLVALKDDDDPEANGIILEDEILYSIVRHMGEHRNPDQELGYNDVLSLYEYGKQEMSIKDDE